LIRQAADKVQCILGETPEIEMGELRATGGGPGLWGGGHSRVVVTSVQTMCRPNRLERFAAPKFGLVIVDEAHHATAACYRRVLDHYKRKPAVRVLGVTATPDRADEEALGQVFDSVAFTYEIPDAIRDGWLVPIEQQFVVVENLDFSAVKT